VFARAFAQMIVTEIGRMKDGRPLDRQLHDEFKNMAQSKKGDQHFTWSRDEFAGLRDKLIELLNDPKAKWTLRPTK
jgi:hypothetical protein